MSHPMIDEQVKRLRRRVRLLFVERYGLLGGCVGAALAAVVVALSSTYDALLSYALWTAIPLIGAAAGCAYGLLRRLDDMSVAVSADLRSGLKERLSTALALDGPSETDVTRAIVEDASERAAALKPSDVFRHRFGAPHIAFAVALIALLGVIFIPQTGLFQSATKRADAKTMKREGDKIVKVAKDIQNRFGRKHEELKSIAAKMENLGRKMQTGRMNRKQAMLQTRKLTKEIQEQQDRLARQNSGGGKSMEQARADMERVSRQITRERAEQSAKSGQKSTQKGAPSDKRLAELARKQGPLTQAEQNELQKAIEKHAEADSRSAIPSELGEALAKLAQNKDFAKASELMQKLAQKQQSGKLSEADRKSLQKQMEQLAKALKGTDLDKLAKQYLKDAQKLAQMSPEQLQKLIKQAQEAQKMAQALQQAGGT